MNTLSYNDNDTWFVNSDCVKRHSMSEYDEEDCRNMIRGAMIEKSQRSHPAIKRHCDWLIRLAKNRLYELSLH